MSAKAIYDIVKITSKVVTGVCAISESCQKENTTSSDSKPDSDPILYEDQRTYNAKSNQNC